MKDTPNRIQYLDGIRFKRVINAAAGRLIKKHEHLNAINVFPVPDGDTGSNMAGTMRNIISSSADSLDQSIAKMSDIIAESALMGARGNSGVILAQWLCGFSEGVKHLSRVNPKDFAEASSHAAQRAYEAIANPKEGTILTVIRDWSDHLKANVDNYNNFHDLLHDSLVHAKQSLKETKEKLASLKAADVVDAGAQGFIYLLEGIVEFTETGTLNRKNERDLIPEETVNVQDRVAVDELEFTYCTECMIKGEDIDKKALRQRIETMGDSIVVAGTGTTVRVHIHTNEPEIIFDIAGEFGDVSLRKAENMLEQHKELLADATQRTGILTDSTCDLPQELIDKYGIRVAPLRLFLDGEEYVDKETISTEDFNARLLTSQEARTSQPSPGDFKRLYEELKQEYQEIAALHVMDMYSGTHQSSKTVAKSVSDKILTLDSRTLTVGLGLVTLEAAKRAKRGASAEEIIRHAKRDTDNVRVYVAMDTLDFAVRGGRMSRGQGYLAKLLNIKPVVEFASRNAGKVDVVSKSIGPRRCENRLMQMIADTVRGKRNLRFAIAHVDNPEAAERFASHIRREYGTEPQFILPASPVLGCHSGPGACAVSVLYDDQH